jgi:phospholipid/cholesterol/gamma-HCH transport system ATP-binding protein
MPDRAADILVDIDDLHFARGKRSILGGLNMQVRRGEITAIMGPSGTEKPLCCA